MSSMKTAAAFGVLVSLTACSTLDGLTDSISNAGKVDYKAGAKQRNTPLEVPPDLTRPGRDDRYAAEGESATYSDFQSVKGGVAVQESEILPDIGKMKIGRAGNERWLVVPGSPEQVWPRVRKFWVDNGFTLVVDKPELGLLETDWVEKRTNVSQDFIRNALSKVFDSAFSSAERDRYRIRLEPGQEANTVEVYVSHRGVEEELTGAQKESSTWVWRKPDPGLEAEMLRRMMLALGLQEDRVRELMATTEPTDRARFERAVDGGAALVFVEPIDVAWREVGVALDRTGFAVEDRDRTLGLYSVRATEPTSVVLAPKRDESNGSTLFSKLMFWEGWFGDKKEPATAQPQRDVNLQPGVAYRIFVNGDKHRSVVRVLDQNGTVDKGEDASKILKLLFEQLK